MLRHLLLNWAIEFAPNLVFFLVFRWSDFFTATKALIVAIIVSIVVAHVTHRRVPLFPIVGGGLAVLFGLLTLILHEPQFLMFEVTLGNGLMALLILGSLYLKRNLFRRLFGDLLALSEKGWHTLAERWGIFLLIYAILNEMVRARFAEATWVHFRFFMFFVMLAFGLSQIRLTHRERLTRFANSIGMKIK